MAAMSEELKVILTAQNQTTAAFASFSKDLNSLKNDVLKVAGAIAGALAIRDVIQTTTSWAEAVRKVQQVTGLTAEQASRLSFAAKALGIDSDELAVSLDR